MLLQSSMTTILFEQLRKGTGTRPIKTDEGELTVPGTPKGEPEARLEQCSAAQVRSAASAPPQCPQSALQPMRSCINRSNQPYTKYTQHSMISITIAET